MSKNKKTIKNVTVDLYKGTIEELLKVIDHQKEVIKKLNKKEIKLRDKIAAEIYVRHYDDAKSSESAAQHAYTTADTFLRIRESALDMEVVFEKPKTEENEKSE